MGDDRHGRTPRPGDRAPWERYPTAESTEGDGSRASRRSRHTDTSDESGSAPLTVQDLVQKVDGERTGRRRRAAQPEDTARGGTRHRSEPPEPRPGPRAEQPEPRPRAEQPRTRGEQPPRRPDQPRKRADQPARRPDQPARSSGSPVVQDITGSRAAVSRQTPDERPAPRRGKEPPEAVTDVLPPVGETSRKRRPKAWPTLDRAAAPESVGLSRLALSKKRRNQRLKTAGRVALSLFAILALVATGGGWSWMRATGNGLTQISALGNNPEDVLDSNLQLGDENYLLVGTDTRAGVNGAIGAGTLEDAEGARADTVMLVNIPKDRSRVVVVSFPRDLDVTRPSCEGWDNDKGSYTGEKFQSAIGDKLNAVYALGGPKCITDTIRKMTGSMINHFIGIDFAGFEAMVNAIGGVEVCTNKPLIDDELGTVLESSGKQKIDGATALNYVRARHVYGEERSDYDRINRQQRFLASLLRGALSSKVLFDLGTLNGFVNEFKKATWVDSVQTDDLLTLGRSLQKMDAGAVTFLTIPTAGTTSYGNEIPRESDIKAIFSAIRNDQPLPGEKTAPEVGSPTSQAPAPPKLHAVDPSTLSLRVSNASDTTGLAGAAATKLGNQGFGIYSTGNYSKGQVPTSRIRYASGHEAEAATVASSIPGSSLEPAEELGSIIEVVLGNDYTGTVRPPVDIGEELPVVPIGTPASAGPVTLPSDLEHMNAADDICK